MWEQTRRFVRSPNITREINELKSWHLTIATDQRALRVSHSKNCQNWSILQLMNAQRKALKQSEPPAESLNPSTEGSKGQTEYQLPSWAQEIADNLNRN